MSERRNGGEPELDVTFPRSNDLSNIVSEPKPPAFITIPGELLRDKYKGKLLIWATSHILVIRQLPYLCSMATHDKQVLCRSKWIGLENSRGGVILRVCVSLSSWKLVQFTSLLGILVTVWLKWWYTQTRNSISKLSYETRLGTIVSVTCHLPTSLQVT